MITALIDDQDLAFEVFLVIIIAVKASYSKI